ncbi:MAG: gfo/Idh/MocA family oxidoreductase [Armatimonadetes bacterium]|nr:gfo/Idh/MocA family oxidoreductase [Armatimonadota bacterium]
MSKRLRWGILATGSIANQFAEGLSVCNSGELVAVGSRTLDRATAFCEKHGGTPYGSYAEVYNHPDVDAVYIATPHHMHMDDTIAVAKAGKGILCEKPFTLNAVEAERALAAVKEAGVFFMEAFMYRCTKQTAKVREWISSGAIGEVKLVNAEFAFQAGEDWANFRNDPELGGGGLMDVGTYCVSIARMAFGEEPSDVSYISQKSAKGVDWIGSGQLRFSGDRSAVFTTGVGIVCDNGATIYGNKGRIVIEDPWKQRTGAKLHRYEGYSLAETVDLSITNAELYAAEADAVAEFFDQKECPYVTLEDTMQQMRTLDKLRKSAGIVFGAEAKA